MQSFCAPPPFRKRRRHFWMAPYILTLPAGKMVHFPNNLFFWEDKDFFGRSSVGVIWGIIDLLHPEYLRQQCGTTTQHSPLSSSSHMTMLPGSNGKKCSFDNGLFLRYEKPFQSTLIVPHSQNGIHTDQFSGIYTFMKCWSWHMFLNDWENRHKNGCSIFKIGAFSWKYLICRKNLKRTLYK